MNDQTDSKAIRVLVLEDNPRDAEINLRELQRAGYQADWIRVQTEQSFLEALEPVPDLILSDYAMPQFDGMRAVLLLRARGLDIPFILISGTLGEEAAINSINHGVDDYLLKGNLKRLGTAVAGALAKKRLRDEQREAEQEKQLALEKFRVAAERQTAILNALPAHIALLDREGIIVAVNESWRRFGSANLLQSSDFFVGQNYLAVCENAKGDSADGAISVAAGIRSVLSREKLEFVFEYPCHLPRKQQWFRLLVSPLSEESQTGVVVMHVDITDRKLAEVTLRMKEQEQRHLAEALTLETKRLHESQAVASVGSWETNLATHEVVWTVETYRIFETSPDRCKPTHAHFMDMVHPEDRKMVDDIFARSIGQPGQFEIEHRLWLPGDTIKFVEERWQTYNDDAGNPVRAVGTCQDITARKRAEESGVRLATAVEQASETIVITDLEGTILYVNPAFETTSGYSAGEAIGQNARLLKSGNHEAGFYAEMWAVIKRGEVWRGRFTNRRKDGSLYEEETTISAVRNAAGKPINYVAVRRDVTREVQLEHQFRQAQKMESIGQLAGGVAHDFNNILGAMMMQADLAGYVENTPSEVLEGLAEIKASAERAANLTRQLLLFSRKQTMQLRPVDLNLLVTNLAQMLRRLIQENVNLQLHQHSAALFTLADAGMLDQLLMNLTVNARDAMPDGGELIIKTGACNLSDKEVELNRDASPGSYVWLSVGDTGCGMAPEVQERIFDPFFTTKAAGKGTGLGLATVFGIVKQHKGWIKVLSEVGKGTTFQIFLPASETTAEVSHQQQSKPNRRGGSETILLTEDETALRILTRIVLERSGYQVLEAADGVAAEQIWSEHKDKIALLLTDLVMPRGVDGRQLAARLRSERPDLKVIFTSGYSEDIAGRELKLQAGQDFLQKPSSPHLLLETVRNCLDGKIRENLP